MMQLPTCKTYAERKGQKVQAILRELESSGFSGYCTLLIEGRYHFLVTEQGSVRLAEAQGMAGARALEHIRLLGRNEADAILCPLTPPQLDAVLRANEQYAVPPADAGKPAAPAGGGAVTKVRPVQIRKGEGRQVQIKRVVSMAESSGRETGDAGAVKPRGPQPAPESRKIDRLTLESIKELKSTFEMDAADLLKELRMEHLIVKEKKGSETPGGADAANEQSG